MSEAHRQAITTREGRARAAEPANSSQQVGDAAEQHSGMARLGPFVGLSVAAVLALRLLARESPATLIGVSAVAGLAVLLRSFSRQHRPVGAMREIDADDEPSEGLAAPSVRTEPRQAADQRVFIRLPHAMLMTAAGAQRSASEVIAKVTGTQARTRTLEAIPEIAVGRITPDEQARLLREGAQVFRDVQFKIFDEALKPEPPARFWEAPGLSAPATNVSTLTDVMQHVRADRVWEVTEGRGVTIAVVDSGIAPDLPELPAGPGARWSTPGASIPGRTGRTRWGTAPCARRSPPAAGVAWRSAASRRRRPCSPPGVTCPRSTYPPFTRA